MNDFYSKALRDIEKNGCHIIYEEATFERPSFTYTIGMEQSSKCPEIVVTGMDKDIAHFLVNEYNSRIQDGETFEAEEFYDEFLEEFQVTFKVVDPKYYGRYFPLAREFYKGDDFRALHFIWPDIDGAWPWQKKASKDYRFLMPPLYIR